MLNIAVLVSGGGTNLQAMLDAKARGEIPNGRFACVVASNPKAYALERAKNAGVETEVLVRKEFSTQDAYDGASHKNIPYGISLNTSTQHTAQ